MIYDATSRHHFNYMVIPFCSCSTDTSDWKHVSSVQHVSVSDTTLTHAVTLNPFYFVKNIVSLSMLCPVSISVSVLNSSTAQLKQGMDRKVQKIGGKNIADQMQVKINKELQRKSLANHKTLIAQED